MNLVIDFGCHPICILFEGMILIKSIGNVCSKSKRRGFIGDHSHNEANTACVDACVAVAACSCNFRPALTREENVEMDSRTKLAVMNEYVAFCIRHAANCVFATV